jgi:hypothetical protein
MSFGTITITHNSGVQYTYQNVGGLTIEEGFVKLSSHMGAVFVMHNVNCVDDITLQDRLEGHV